MEITWLAHSCFRLRSNDVTVLTDPFPDSIGATMGQVQPTIATVSNRHPNHSHVADLQGDFHLIDGPGEYAISGVYIRGVMTPLNPEEPLEGRNTAYFMEMEGLRLCHPGDLNATFLGQHVGEVTPVDVLFAPAGGHCTLELNRIGDLIQALSPRLVVPMHYKVPGISIELGHLDPFLREMGTKAEEPQSRLSVTATSLPAQTRVVVLRPVGVGPGG